MTGHRSAILAGVASSNGHTHRLAGIADDAVIRSERAVIAAVAYDLASIERHGITGDLIDDPGLRLLLIALMVYRRQYPQAEQCPASALIRFAASVPELSRLICSPDAEPTGDSLTADEIAQMLDSGWHDIDLIQGNLETLRDAAFERERRLKLVELERLPRDRFAAELKAWLPTIETVEDSGIVTIWEMVDQYPSLREPIIDGILRRGEVANLISKSKVGKSWTGYGLGLSVATGGCWLDRFRCQQGNVLLIDNELHQEDIAHRVPSVADALSIMQSEYHDRFDVLSLRGRLRSIFEIGSMVKPDTYSLVIVDALYRMLGSGMSENDNASMAQIYNEIDRLAEKTGSAFILIHHSSKGDQGGKDVTDVGSGAGSQSRAADAHIILRPHEEEGCVVLDAAVRSFAPIEPLVLRWNFLVWAPAEELDPKSLKRPKTRGDERQESTDRDGCGRIVGILQDLNGEGTPRQIRNASGIGLDRLNRLLSIMVSDGRLTSEPTTIRGNETSIYRLSNHLNRNVV